MDEEENRFCYWLLFIFFSFGSVLITLLIGSGIKFTSDEYSLLSIIGSGSFSEMFAPYVGHLTFGGQLIYKLILDAFGSGHYWVFQLVASLARVFLAAMVFIYSKEKVGQLIAFLLSLVILFFSADWLHVLFGNGMIIVLPLALGVLSLILIGVKKPILEPVALIALLAAVSIYTTAVPFVIAVLVYAILFNRRAAWVPGLVLIFYGAWRILIASQSRETEDGGINFFNLIDLPVWAFTQTAFTIRSLFPWHLSDEISYVLAGTFFLAAALVLVFKKESEILVPLAGLLSLFAAQVIVLDTFRGQEGDIERYLYPNLVFILLVSVFIFKNINFKYLPVILIATTGLAIATNIIYLSGKTEGLQAAQVIREAEISAARLALSATPPVKNEDQPRGRGKSNLRKSFNWARASKWGPVGFQPNAFPATDDRINRIVDHYLFLSYKIQQGPLLPDKNTCQETSGRILVPENGINIYPGGGEVHLGRFSEFLTLSLGAADRPFSVKIRPDESPVSWVIAIRPGSRVTVCG